MAVLFFFMALSILSLNCNGIRDSSKRAGLVQWLRSLAVVVDVICLQETHCSSVVEFSSWFASSGWSCAVSPGSARSCGCIMLYRPCLSLVNSRCDSDGRFLQCEFSFCGRSFHVACVYAPNRNPARDLFFDDVSALVDPTVPTVLCGDFNAVFDRLLDRMGSSPEDTSRESCVALRRLFNLCCVEDIWRYLHPSVSGFTWSRWDHSCASRIDLFGVPYAWVPHVASCDILACPFSDHCGVLMFLSVPDAVPPGPGLWKLNVSVLDDDDYFSLIADF